MTALATEIRETRVEPGSLALWFLGQNGWVVKSPGGGVVAVDPYLTDSCNPSRRGLDLARMVPPPLAPEELEADLVVCTHSHRDHADPATLAACAWSGRIGGFLGPGDTQTVFADAGIAEGDRDLLWPNRVIEHGDLRLTGTFALPTDAGDLNHVGLLIQAGGGPKLWITGDTGWHDRLAEAGLKHLPDVVCVPINGGYGNLSHWEAAELVRRVGPALAIPCHWDLFPDNACPPRQFQASLTVKGLRQLYHEPVHGQRLILTAHRA
ncbi:MBL fold metallo-hydrolase [Phaeospirillum tilakii]|uniref:MBL fold metallo-hydrolase n=1 Tax=Phaeospirillum tilakii TaxID=741673 RepID=A0ABW5C5B0_9PROT